MRGRLSERLTSSPPATPASSSSPNSRTGLEGNGYGGRKVVMTRNAPGVAPLSQDQRRVVHHLVGDDMLRLRKRAEIACNGGAQERVHPPEHVVLADRAAHPAHARLALARGHVG